MTKVTWEPVVKRPMTILTQDFFLTGVDREFKKLLGLSYDAGLVCKDGVGTVIEGKESKKKLERSLKKRSQKNKQFFKKHLETGESAMKNLLLTSAIVKQSPLDISDKGLLKLLKLYKRAFHRFSPYLFSVFPIENVLTGMLKKKLKSNEEKFRILTTVQRDSDFYLEQKDLLELLIDEKSGKDIDVALESHANLFGYMGLTNDFASEPWDRDHFKGYFKDYKDPKKDLSKLVASRKKELEIYQEFIKDLPKETIELAEILQNYMWFRNERISVLKIAQNNIKRLLVEIASRFRISFEDLIWYKVVEIENLLKDGIKAGIAGRKQYIRVELAGGKLFYFEKEVKQAIQKKEVRVIRGAVASVGKVKGIVKILSSYTEIDKVKEGDILVTSMTTPDFVTAMRKSAAIITDEGGVLCHAAIVSREFGIPCIIGTQIATQVLKDGDKVFVDAEKGIVHILK